ncbi:MAG: M48 family metallopeptidase, partial [SAR324 cluster bacterium]|nr:M48 family metallopeptidase [SAR324 cluster bacterium]
QYFDGRTPTHMNVVLSADTRGVWIKFEDGSGRFWHRVDFRLQLGLQEGPVRLEYGEYPPETLVVDDPEFGSNFGKNFTNRNRLFTPLLALLTVIIFPALIYWGIPSVSGLFASFIPLSIEQQLGKYVIDEIFPNRVICETAAGRQALEKLLTRLAPADSDYEFQLEIIDSDWVNALAFPGGKILIFSGLLRKSHSAEALSGVLAHEMQHVLERHGTENLLSQTALSGLFKLLVGEANALTETIFQGVKTLSLLKYTRELETEADALALQLLIQAKVDSDEMLAMFRVLQKQSPSLPESFSTHPDMSSRLKRLETLIAQNLEYVSEPILSESSWKSLQNICQS